jgi:hypothetical protein
MLGMINPRLGTDHLSHEGWIGELALAQAEDDED